LFVVLVVVVILAAVGLWSWRQQPGESFVFSIDRSVIKPGGNATITVTVENFDHLTHNVEYRFNVSDRLQIHEGAENPLPRIGSEYLFNYTLGAADPSETKVFVVIGNLEKQVSSATYSISLAIYFDGEKRDKTWSDLTLKVEE
jgi:hypothetical protein